MGLSPATEIPKMRQEMTNQQCELGLGLLQPFFYHFEILTFPSIFSGLWQSLRLRFHDSEIFFFKLRNEFDDPILLSHLLDHVQ